ncbi:MAG: malto-oligosyltrehalose trehalohydrolase [Candidatus Omnitrophica bacterium]|nr:malto-oligosyltrehalose trehalohydrolase [Candidatus Omnitrophota bacterium]
MKNGAFYASGQSLFSVWAPNCSKLELKLCHPRSRTIPMKQDDQGYWSVRVEDVSPGTLYLYVINQEHECPDPASFFQPRGVHQPSALVEHHAFQWQDRDWKSVALSEMILYELHVGTFTREGTFFSAVERLDYLVDLGINAVEIMPVSQFPGGRNWGYDGVHPFAVQNTYGGPAGMKEFVNACHFKGLSVILDVVYNHLGPEGNYLGHFGPYFTDRYQTPWGSAINFDGPDCGGVRQFFIDNALYWYEYFHLDGLRLDAVHGICDFGARHFLSELSDCVRAKIDGQKRSFYLIAESDLNDTHIIDDKQKGGLALDAQWLDDFHHSIRTIMTEERTGYYQDFGAPSQLLKALKEGFVFSWDYSLHRRKKYGSSSGHILPRQFIAFIQNHDQVGNRMLGERLSHLVPFESLKCCAAIMLLSPYVPMLFMGEEFAQKNPFMYFISHLDPQLVQAVREGRKKEFQSFHWKVEPPDPNSEDVFLQSKIQWDIIAEGRHAQMLSFYQSLIALRKSQPALRHFDREDYQVFLTNDDRVLMMHRKHKASSIFIIVNISVQSVNLGIPHLPLPHKKCLDSAAPDWGGPGCLAVDRIRSGDNIKLQPHHVCVYEGEK